MASVKGREAAEEGAAASARVGGSPRWLVWGGAARGHAIVELAQGVGVGDQGGQVALAGGAWGSEVKSVRAKTSQHSMGFIECCRELNIHKSDKFFF